MTRLERLGWSPKFAAALNEFPGFQPGRVLAEHRSLYQVALEEADVSARITGRLRYESESSAELPAVGDWVALQPSGDSASIHAILPRKSKFSRKVAGEKTAEQVVAANIDFAWIVTALDQDFSLRRIERYMTLVWESGASPVVVLSKADLCDRPEQLAGQVEAVTLGTPIHLTSSLDQGSVDALRRYLEGNSTVAMLGSSGVGKSTLINTLAGETLQETGAVRGDGKGRHTTTYRQLLCLSGGGSIVDSPGMRELQLWGDGSGIEDTFGDIEEVAGLCRFDDCRHDREPGCEVRRLVEEGRLPRERLESYHKLQRELAYLDRRQDAFAQQKQKQQIKTMMKSLRDHPKYKRS